MSRNSCVICGNSITANFWACASCEKAYEFEDKPYSEWPEWVKELIRFTRRERTRQARASEYEIPMSYLETDGFDPFEFLTNNKQRKIICR